MSVGTLEGSLHIPSSIFYQRVQGRVRAGLSTDISLRLLDRSLGNQVLVRLRNGRLVRGTLVGFDKHMNVVLNPAEEVLQGGNSVRLGTVLVRGDNIVMLSPSRLREGGER
jgi:small nuclear ribonucleoprotein